jgi:hypothetical protein
LPTDEGAGISGDDWRAITRLELIAEQGEAFRFRLTFAKDGVSLFINGDDRDAVFLLFSDRYPPAFAGMT